MHRFNLTFRGKIQPGCNPDTVRQRFAALLGIDDPQYLARCFSGETLVLRDDLDRKAAADLFRKLDQLGAIAELTRNEAAEHAREAARASAEREAKGPRPDPGNASNGSRAAAPNPYALTPFRSTGALRERPARAQTLKRRYRAAAIAALLALAAALVARTLWAPPPPLTGPVAVAAAHGGGLILVTPDALLLHDRAGVGSASIALGALGLSTVTQIEPLPNSQDYLVIGRGVATAHAPRGDPGVWRCQLAERRCTAFGFLDVSPADVASHPFSGIVLEAVPKAGELRKLNSAGELQARAPRPFGPRSRLHLQDGLLYTNSSEGPALSVLRYEDAALGQQLDEVLLLAPAALEAGRERVGDFTFLGEQWWAILHHPQTGDGGVYGFDRQWAFLRELALPDGFEPRQLLAWGQKLLVLDPRWPTLQRFNAAGQPEVPLHSDLLQDLIEAREHSRWLHAVLWRALTIALSLLAIGAGVLAYLQYLRQLAFKPERLRGAEPIESEVERVRWMARPPGRDRDLRRLTRFYLACACLLLVGAVVARVEAHHLAALLVLLAGPATALGLYLRSPPAFIGVLGESLLLVDHRHTYHLGSGARVLYHDWFLMIDDVLVHAGPGLCPAFDTGELREHIVPLASRGVRVDRRSVLVRLVEGRHPLVLGAALILAAAVSAAAIALG